MASQVQVYKLASRNANSAIGSVGVVQNTQHATRWCTKKQQQQHRVVGVACGGAMANKGGSGGLSLRVSSSLDTSAAAAATAGAPVVVGQVTQVDKETFWPTVNAAGDKTVVLDMYTQCGPCKVMAPKFQELSEKYLDVVFLKLDCNQENRLLAKELGIKVVPTFKILKNSKIVKEVRGAKFDDLVFVIESVRSS